MKNQHLIDNLSTSEKADLFQHLYAELAGQGTDGDTELAHVNRFEAQVLRNIGGSGTVNEVTGFRQYGKGGSPPPPPDTTTTKNVPEYAPEQREYIRDIFGKSQELYEQRMEEGYKGGPDARMADLDPRETEAFTGMADLARGPGPARAYDIARNAALGAAAPITAGEVQQGMNPYQQAVTDIGKREAVRQYQRGPQAQLRTGAVESGGLRGARRFIEEGEGQRNLNQQLADLQTMGSQQAFQQSMAEAAAARGRLKNLATQMPGIGQGAYDQRMRQYGQLGGVGEAYRDREQSAINLAQEKFLQEQAFPEEQLGRYLRFITNAPSPSGFSRTVTAPGVRGPSTIAQLGGLAGGLGTLAGGLGGTGGLFSRGGAVLPASGRRAGLSGVVRRASGGQIVRMQDGGPPPIDFRSRMPNRKTLGAKFLQNLLDVEGIAETRVDDIQKSFNTAPGVPTVREQGDFLYPNKGLGSGIDPYMELVAGLDSEQIEKMTPSKPKVEETVVEKDTTPAPEAPEKEQSLAERYAAYRKLMEGDEEETGLSWPERLQIASALFGATDTPSTGSFLGDLSQFGAQVSPGVAKGLAARDARELAAKKRRIQSVKDFRDFVREEKLDAREAAKLAAEVNLKGAQTNEIIRKSNNPEVASPSEVDITGAISYLDRTGIPVLETSKEKGKYGKAGSAYQLAQVAKSLKTSADNALRIARENQAVGQDPDGRLIIDVDKAIRGGSRRVDQPVRGVTRGADGKLVAKAEGGMIGEKPVLRYPEDFS